MRHHITLTGPTARQVAIEAVQRSDGQRERHLDVTFTQLSKHVLTLVDALVAYKCGIVRIGRLILVSLCFFSTE